MSVGIKLRKIYRVGYCVSFAALAQKSLGWKRARFYARAFLLEHPQQGLVLIDTGYGAASKKAFQRGIHRLYSALLPVHFRDEESLVSQLAQDGIVPNDLSWLIATHFHPDHVGALPEFTETRFIYRKEALDTLSSLFPWQQLRKGFLSDLIPPIPSDSRPILESDFQGSWNGFPSVDLFDDGSLFLVDLPGHALGQMGVATSNQFFVADAQWSAKGPPHPISFCLQDDSMAYRRTYEAIEKLHSRTEIFPNHEIEVI